MDLAADLQAPANTPDVAEPFTAVHKKGIQTAETQEIRQVKNAASWDAFDEDLRRASEAQHALPALQPVCGAEPLWAVDTVEGFQQAHVQLRLRNWEANLNCPVLLPQGTAIPASSAVQGSQVALVQLFLSYLPILCQCIRTLVKSVSELL
jgi:hypothetical protein